jgi:general secretion pathway protein D
MELDTYPIKWANATEVARLINDVFSQNAAQANPFANLFNQFQGQRARGNQGRGGGAATVFNVPGGLNLNGQQGSTVKASSDDYSNTVTVNATASDQAQVLKIIRQIDKQTDTPITPKVFKLQFAKASDIASVVQNVLTVNAPKGRGGQGNQQQNVGAQFGLALARGGQAAFGNVVADNRTNSLIVSTTVENLALVDQVIKDLDQPTEIQDTTFVFSLQNANATTVGGLLQAAFGTRTGASGTGQQALQQNRATTPTTPNVTTKANTSTSSSGARTGAENLGGAGQDANALSDDQKNLLLALQDPNADAGELLTSVAVTQGGFGGGRGGGGGFNFGGQGSQQTGSAQTSTDASGRVVGTNDLTGQITIIPDINTNSLIIVGPPNSVPILKKILDQLDKVPEQVMIDVIIVEANLTAADQFGLEWKAAQQRVFGNPSSSGQASQNFGLQSATTPLQGFSYALTGNDLSGFFNMLKTDTKFDVLSTPKIFTTNNIQATINISQSIPYVLSTIQDATTGSLSYNYAFENVGIVLTVTPRITAGGNVDLSIDQTANDLQGYTSFNAPIVNQREANTEVQVADGKTVILGGIIQRSVSATVNKIPLLGDLPLLGNLFRSTNKSVSKTELLIFLTPHLVKTPEEAEKLKNQSIIEATPRTQKAIQEVIKTGSPITDDKTKATKTPPVKTTDSHGAGSGASGTTVGGNS